MRPLLLLILIAFLPLASAATMTGSLTATTVQGQQVTGTAHLIGFFQEARLGGDAATPDYSVHAESLRVEVDEADPVFDGPAGPVFVSSPAANPVSYSNADMTGTSVANDYRWNLFALDPSNPPSVEIQTSCGTVQTAKSQTVERAPILPRGHGTISRDSSQVLTWTCLDGATVVVQGDFVLSLWSWNSVIQAGSETSLNTGRQQTSYPDPSGTLHHESEAYVYATHASLTVTHLTASGATLLTTGATIASPSLSLQDARGTLTVQGAATPVDQKSLDLHGASTLTLSSTGNAEPMTAGLRGDISGYDLDGSRHAVATPTGQSWFPAVAALIVVVGLAAWRYGRPLRYTNPRAWAFEAPVMTEASSWRERRGTGYWVMARNALVAENYRRARKLARRATRWFPRSADSRLMQAVAELNLHRDEQALRTVQDLLPMLSDPLERAEVGCLAARACMNLGNHARALAYLQQAREADAAIFGQEIASKTYDPLVTDGVFRSLRQAWSLVRELHDPSVA